MHEVFKVLGPGGLPCHGGTGPWSLPTEEGPGDWRSVEGKLVACRNGLHLCPDNRLLYWLGPCLYVAEYRGEIIEHTDKLIVREARLLRQLPWDDRTARLFACDCAERVLAHYEAVYPGDDRVLQAIVVSRRFALGQATPDQLAEAHKAAGAARDNAEKASLAAWAVPSFVLEPSACSPAASWAVTSAALWAAREAARAGANAAGDDATEAATAAVDNAREAAGAAAQAAHEDGSEAGRAEHAWQTARLLEVLGVATP